MKRLLLTLCFTQLAACGGAPDPADSYCAYWGEKAVTCGFLSPDELDSDLCAEAMREGFSDDRIPAIEEQLRSMTCDEWLDAIMGGA